MKKPAPSLINVVPYIDVLLVLLVIFMVASNGQKSSMVDLPRAGAGSAVPAKVVRLTLVPSGEALWDGDAVEESALPSLLAPLPPETPIVIEADTRLSYGQVARWMNLLKENGAKRVGLLMQETRGKKAP